MSKLGYKLGELAPIYQHTETGNLIGDELAEILVGWEVTNLVCDKNTKIVFYAETGTPYISKNGRFCRLINEEIVEL